MGDAQDKEPLQPNDLSRTTVNNSGRNNGNINTPSSSQEFGYEELSNGLTCPTCQGTGKIPRGQEDDLVALIPYRDERLKPRRTTLYVCLAVFICMAIAGTLCAFLIPRPISFIEDHVTTVSANFTSSVILKKTLYLEVMNFYNVSNENFLALTVNNVTMQVISTFRGHIINQQKMQVLDLDIPLRTKQQFSVPVNLTINEEDYPIKEYCDPSKVSSHAIYMIFTTTLYYQYMFQNSQSSLTHYQLVSCINPEDPPYAGR